MSAGPKPGTGRAIVALAALLVALAQVAWRQSATQETMAELDRLSERLVAAADEEGETRRRLATLEGRRWVAEQAARRLGLRPAAEGDLVVASGSLR